MNVVSCTIKAFKCMEQNVHLWFEQQSRTSEKSTGNEKDSSGSTGNDGFFSPAATVGGGFFAGHQSQLARETFGSYSFLLAGRRGDHSHIGEGEYISCLTE
jgi:hypothetical protein